MLSAEQSVDTKWLLTAGKAYQRAVTYCKDLSNEVCTSSVC